MRRAALVLVAAAAVAGGWGGWYWLSPTPKAAPLQLPDLTPAGRARLDRAALASPLETVPQEKVNFAGDVTAWVISQAVPTPAEEAKRAAGVREHLLDKYRTVPTPEAADRLLHQLTDQLPPHLKPEQFTYTLTVLDLPEPNVFTCGAGAVYITRPIVERLLERRGRGEAALAFVLAHELCHTALLHCRRGWQLDALQEEIDQGLQLGVPIDTVRTLVQTGVAGAGSLVPFLYSRDQEYEADLFALHLCRNAGIDPDQALDAMRYLAALTHPDALSRDDYRPDPAADRSALTYYLSSHPDALFRLKRLLMERDGTVDDEGRYGLFAYDRRARTFTRCGAGAVGAGQRPIILVHGLGGGSDSFTDLLAYLAGRDEVRDRPLLVFRYPNNESLARAGHFLHREVVRVVAEPKAAGFVCHSAGGLVFRCYAEKLHGDFDRVVFLGTPNSGSDLARLRLLAEVVELAHDAVASLPLPGPNPMAEGRGQIVHDLHPDSLFLRYLGHDAALARRYRILYGRRLDALQALALRTGFAAVQPLLRERLAGQVPSPSLRRGALGVLDNLAPPEEVLNGDLAVTVASACLEGVDAAVATALDHQTLKTDPAVMSRVLAVLVGQSSSDGIP